MEKESPLKHKPTALPMPGESGQEALREKIADHWIQWAGYAVLFWVLAWMDWYRHIFSIRVRPLETTILAAIVTVFAAWRIWRRFPEWRAMKEGWKGEVFVGQLLDGLRGRGYQVFHDVPGPEANIDHVLIGPTGVYAIETKTIGKPKGATIRFDGARVNVPGTPQDFDPIPQVRACASQLRKLIKNSTSHEILVRPVIVFPGWFVMTSKKNTEIWVLNPEQIEGYLAFDSEKLSEEEVSLYSHRVAEHCRTWARER